MGIKVTYLPAGANPNTKNDIWDTPLHEASIHGHAEVVKLLKAVG